MTTTEFDPAIFPYVFECNRCGSTLEITHDGATKAVPPGTEATPAQAVKQARRGEGWWITSPDGLLCPECMDARA